MSMYRQLWLAIIISMLFALGGGLLASLLSARTYLESQLTIKNSDNATALALALSASSPDETMVELTVASLFDGGHYEWIRVVGPSGASIVDKTSAEGDVGAPKWFVWILPIHAEAGRAQISNGWSQVGTVSLASHSKYVYAALWKSAYEMAIALTLAGILGGFLGTLVLRRIRQPLEAVIGQARAIAQRRFVSIVEPKVPELRQLSTAMNAMVSRLKSMFDEEAARLEVMRREANCDELTGLSNRSSFLAALQQSLDAEHACGGTLILIRLDDLAGMNQRLGRETTDDYLRRAAMTIGESIPAVGQGLAARLNGSDFALLLAADQNGMPLAEALLLRLTQLVTPFAKSYVAAWVAMVGFEKGAEMQEVLARADLALAAAQSDGVYAVGETQFSVEVNTPRTAEQWRLTIGRSLQQGWVRLVSFPVVDMAGELLHQEHMLRIKFDEQGEWQPAGQFFPMAERLQLSAQIDLVSISLSLKALAHDQNMPGLAVNLSGFSVGDDKFCQHLLSLLDAQPELATRLWVEVSEVSAFQHIASFRELCVRLEQRGCRVGLEHFGHQFEQIGLLHDLGLDYLKVDSRFVHGVDVNPGNLAFLKGMCSIAHTVGLQVFAEGVSSQSEMSALAKIGFDGATGPVIALQGTVN